MKGVRHPCRAYMHHHNHFGHYHCHFHHHTHGKIERVYYCNDDNDGVLGWEQRNTWRPRRRRSLVSWFAEAFGCPVRNHRKDGQNSISDVGGSGGSGDGGNVLFRISGRSRFGRGSDDVFWRHVYGGGRADRPAAVVPGHVGIHVVSRPHFDRQAGGHQHTESIQDSQGGGRNVSHGDDDGRGDGFGHWNGSSSGEQRHCDRQRIPHFRLGMVI